jgi:hypothetical protein
MPGLSVTRGCTYFFVWVLGGTSSENSDDLSGRGCYIGLKKTLPSACSITTSASDDAPDKFPLSKSTPTRRLIAQSNLAASPVSDSTSGYTASFQYIVNVGYDLAKHRFSFKYIQFSFFGAGISCMLCSMNHALLSPFSCSSWQNSIPLLIEAQEVQLVFVTL